MASRGAQHVLIVDSHSAQDLTAMSGMCVMQKEEASSVIFDNLDQHSEQSLIVKSVPDMS